MGHNLGAAGLLCSSQSRKADEFPTGWDMLMAVFRMPRPHHTVLSIASQDYQEQGGCPGSCWYHRARQVAFLSDYASSFSVEPWSINSSRTNVLSRDDWTQGQWSPCHKSSNRLTTTCRWLQIPAGSCINMLRVSFLPEIPVPLWFWWAWDELCISLRCRRHSWHDWMPSWMEELERTLEWGPLLPASCLCWLRSSGSYFIKTNGCRQARDNSRHVRAFKWWQRNHHCKTSVPTLFSPFYNIRQPRGTIVSLKRTQWEVKVSNS